MHAHHYVFGLYTAAIHTASQRERYPYDERACRLILFGKGWISPSADLSSVIVGVQCSIDCCFLQLRPAFLAETSLCRLIMHSILL